jgi:hypothetical protein
MAGKYTNTAEVHGYADLYTGEIFVVLPVHDDDEPDLTMKHLLPPQALDPNTLDEDGSSCGRRGRFKITVEFEPDVDPNDGVVS